MRLANLIFLGLILGFLPLSIVAQKFDVMSYNIRLDIAIDSVNKWENRKKEMVEMLSHYEPEIIGLQEVLPNQLVYLNDALIDYAYIGVGREDGIEMGEYAPVFYDTTKFTFLTGSSFWLSETSEKPSLGWDAAYKRVCTYGLFQYKKSKHKVWVFNTHFDNKGIKARENAAQLILEKIETINKEGYPIVFMGDLNCDPDSKPIELISEKLNYAYKKSEKIPYGPVGTFNGFNTLDPVTEKIDYIFESNLKILSYSHIDDRMKNNNWVSDHLPVMLKAKFNDK